MGAAVNILSPGTLSIELTGQAAHAAGDSIGHIKNPEGVPIIITDSTVYHITNSTGAANLTVGSGATVAAAHDDATIVASISIGGRAGTSVGSFAHSSAKAALPVVATDHYIVACTDATSAGYTGKLFLRYLRATP